MDPESLLISDGVFPVMLFTVLLKCAAEHNKLNTAHSAGFSVIFRRCAEMLLKGTAEVGCALKAAGFRNRPYFIITEG